MFYEAFRQVLDYGHEHLSDSSSLVKHKFGTFEELVMGGAAGGSRSTFPSES